MENEKNDNMIEFQNDVRKTLLRCQIYNLRFIEDGWVALFQSERFNYQLIFDDGIDLRRKKNGKYLPIYTPLEWGEPYFSRMLGFIV